MRMPTVKEKRFDVRLDRADRARLERLARRTGRSRSEVFRQALVALELMIGNLPKEAPSELTASRKPDRTAKTA